MDYYQKKQIVTLLIAGMALLFIIASFFLEQIFSFLNISMDPRSFKLLKYVFLGIGIWDLLIFLPIFLKIAGKANKQ